MRVARSGFYKWYKNNIHTVCIKNQEIQKQILKIYSDSRENYGRRRVHATLQKQGFTLGINKVARLMKELSLYGYGKPKRKITTKSVKLQPFPNLLSEFDEDKNLKKVNQVWVSDITYIATSEGWLYLCTIMDSFSRKIVGWSMSNSLHAELVTSAIKSSLKARNTEFSMIFHSDRGSQYASNAVRKLLRGKGIRQSMTTIRGKCFENSKAESFFSIIKKELVHKVHFKTREEATIAIFEFIEVIYNKIRPHSALDYKTPDEYESA